MKAKIKQYSYLKIIHKNIKKTIFLNKDIKKCHTAKLTDFVKQL